MHHARWIEKCHMWGHNRLTVSNSLVGTALWREGDPLDHHTIYVGFVHQLHPSYVSSIGCIHHRLCPSSYLHLSHNLFIGFVHLSLHPSIHLLGSVLIELTSKATRVALSNAYSWTTSINWRLTKRLTLWGGVDFQGYQFVPLFEAAISSSSYCFLIYWIYIVLQYMLSL